MSFDGTTQGIRATLGVFLFVPGCAFFGGGGGGGDGGGNETDATSLLSAAIVLPEGGFYIEEEDIEIDETIDIATPSEPVSIDVEGGDILNPSVTFSAPDANVVGFGVRFGESGPIAVTPAPSAVGLTDGTVAGTMTIPPGICNDLAEICHDIKCYEFAVTRAGQISRANITDLALACNNCDEPSCQELLQSCQEVTTGLACEDDGDCASGETCVGNICVGQGVLRVSLIFTAATDLDLHLILPSGSEISFSNRTADGGTLDVDRIPTTPGNNVENIVFPAAPPSGNYGIEVTNFNGRATADFTVEVVGIVNDNFSGSLAAESGATTSFNFSVP